MSDERHTFSTSWCDQDDKVRSVKGRLDAVPDAAVEAEIALATVTGIRWRDGTTEWRGYYINSEGAGAAVVDEKGALVRDGARLRVELCRGNKWIAASTVWATGVDMQHAVSKLRHAVLKWGIRAALAWEAVEAEGTQVVLAKA